MFRNMEACVHRTATVHGLGVKRLFLLLSTMVFGTESFFFFHWRWAEQAVIVITDGGWVLGRCCRFHRLFGSLITL